MFDLVFVIPKTASNWLQQAILARQNFISVPLQLDLVLFIKSSLFFPFFIHYCHDLLFISFISYQ